MAIHGPCCFTAGTKVLTDEGPVPVEEIETGDMVYASDPFTGEEGYREVTRTFENETDSLVELTVNGETVTTTETHPFYVPAKGWTEAAKLRAGDILVTVNGEYAVLEQVSHEITESPVRVYNFEVEGLHTYYVGADESDPGSFVLVHNSCHGNSLSSEKRTELYALRDNNTNQVMKIGETTRGVHRYTHAYYESNNVYMQILDSGTKRAMHYQQHRLLETILDKVGKLPGLNRCLW